MCKPKVPKTPAVVVRDPVKDQQEADNQAQGIANAAIAKRRKTLRSNSLLGMGAAGYAGNDPSMYAQARGVS